MTKTNSNDLSFWEHVDELRSCIIHILVAVLLFGIVAFCFKDFVFSIILAPKSPDFVTYQIFKVIGASLSDFNVQLINTELAQQFLIHIKISFFVGALVVSPYILYSIFKFILPALYASEKRVAFKAIISGYTMFIIGVLLSYFLIFPLTFRFLGTYQVSEIIVNYISLSSYIGTLLTLCVLMGIMFELPILCWILARLGFINADFLKNFRRHAIVAICTLAAIITPTADAFTLFVVAIPIYLLYEVSIKVVKNVRV